tara:strand:- start:813 stop:4541 length:3729 start_codon:yes stop_codon:yes gene_type:complete
VDTDNSDDELIRKRAFKISDSIELEDILIQDEVEEKIIFEEKEVDEALGDIFDPFAKIDKNSPGFIQEDGTVSNPPEIDIITDLAKEGEKKVNWILMASMILVFSGISIIAGIALSPLYATILLVCLALFGLTLGELWVSKNNLNLLGITWIIISMKILYGLAIELQRWEVISFEILGILLLALVGLNVYLSYRHKHDAIAAQSTLILLLIGSAAGYGYGEIGIAVMILMATILVHGLAIHRKSGNLAALGIASTNLWVGMHALTNGFSIGSLTILQLETPLLLFILIMIVTGINASMAAKFAKDENWFSKAFKILGLGEPGLWGVSISLGMIGALMAVGANRQDLGYAIGLISILASSFGGSYLVVRGVETRRVAIPLLISGVILSISLIVFESTSILPFDSYEFFATSGVLITSFVMLRDQNSVTDRVLWTGSVVILILLVIMIPADASEKIVNSGSNGDGGLLLLSLLSLVHIGTAFLAVKRNSPSLAGITVILPWLWLIIEELVEETIRTLVVSNGGVDPGAIIQIEPTPLFGYLAIASLLMAIVNIKLGKNGVNLASKFLGLTEISASIRDSGALQLWSIGLWLPIITIIFMAKFGGFTALTLLGIFAIITALHLISELVRKRIGESSIMLATLALGYTIIQWQYGLEEVLMLIYCIVAITLLLRNDGSDESMYSVGMSLMAIPMLISLVSRNPNDLIDTNIIPSFGITKVSLFCTGALILVYLSKAKEMEKLLNPALASLCLLVINIVLVYNKGEFYEVLIAITIFAISTIWLVANGEVRREIKSIAKRNSLKELAKNQNIEDSYTLIGGVKKFNPKIVELKNKRKNKRETEYTEDIEELYLTDATHRPVIILLVLGLVIGASTIISFIFGTNHLVLLTTGIFVAILAIVARERTKGLELELPHFLGIEMPIAIAISGVVLIQVSGHLAAASSNIELFDMAIMTLLVLFLCIISLMNQKNLIDRVQIAIDWFIMPIFLGRLIGTILYESLPAPFTVNPIKGDLLEWIMPWNILEVLLILLIITMAWVEMKRISTGREPTTNNSLRAWAIVFISTGPAGMLALLLVIYHTIKNQQTVEFGLLIPAVIFVIISLSNWIQQLKGTIDEITLIIGITTLLLCALTVYFKKEIWTMTLATNSHLLIYSGLLWTGMFSTIYLPIILISLSTTIWVIGILQLRRVLRIWGLFDLIIAIVASLLLLGSQILEPTILLISLIVLAMELGLVAWLGLSNEDEIVKD